MKNLKTFAILATMFALAACSNDAPPAAASADAAGQPSTTPEQATATIPESAPQWDESASPVEGTSLIATPTTLDLCAEKIAAAEVAWDATVLEPATLQLWAHHNGKYTLWAAVKSGSGSKTTGKWLRDGSEIILVDPAAKRVLNRVRFEAKPCS